MNGFVKPSAEAKLVWIMPRRENVHKMNGGLAGLVIRSTKSKQGSEKFFKKFLSKIWRVRKKVLPLQPLSETSLEANVQEKKFDGTTFFEDIEQQSFILSFYKERFQNNTFEI